MKCFIFAFTLLFILSCNKTSSDTGTTNSGGGINPVSTSGVLSFNVSWSQPAFINGCGFPVDVTIELRGPNNYFYNETQQVGPVEIRKRLESGGYSYRVTKTKRGACYNVTTVIKTGDFNLPACPTACNNPTVINVVAN